MSFQFANVLQEASQQATESVVPTTNHIENLPDGSIISVICLSAEWRQSEHNPDRISLQWEVTAPLELKGRKAFQSIKVHENENAARMLMGVYYQATKGPYPYGIELPNSTTLSTDLLMCRANLSVREWQMEDNIDDNTGLPRTGNWFDGVAIYDERATKVGTLKFSKNKPKPQKQTQQQAQPTQQNNMANFDAFDSNIPF